LKILAKFLKILANFLQIPEKSGQKWRSTLFDLKKFPQRLQKKQQIKTFF